MKRNASCWTMIPLVILSLSGSSAMSDTLGFPSPRIFASALGAYGVKAITQVGDTGAAFTRLHLFRLDESGGEVVLWSSRIAEWPMTVSVGDNARVVLFDYVGTPIVVLSPRGKIAFKYKLEDLLTPEEIKTHVVKTVSSRLWRDSKTLVEFAKSRVSITLSWGKRIDIDLDKGTLACQDVRANEVSASTKGE